MKRKLLPYGAVAILGVILLFTEPVGANPNFQPSITVDAPNDIAIVFFFDSPQKRDISPNGTMVVCFSVHLVDTNNLCRGLAVTVYQGDWMQAEEWCPNPSGQSYFYDKDFTDGKHFMQYNFTIDNIPYGTHKLTFKAHAGGGYFGSSNYTDRTFSVDQEATITFTVSANPSVFSIVHNENVSIIPSKPSIRLLTPQNINLTCSDLSLNFTVDRLVTKMAYVLDNGKSSPADSNLTLHNLSNGNHNITLSAINQFGHTGTSERLYFNVQALETPYCALEASLVFVIFVIGLVIVLTLRKIPVNSKRKVVP
ncbi:MAG: hypothetical protein NWE92_03755 [Candidatus Bathyarchaeota archaeon]|nr:hypothetical protein [Candidatus Bathyarchaeota archaeon]